MTHQAPGLLFKNESFWMGACWDWALNRTCMLISYYENKNITTKSVRQVIFSQKSQISSKNSGKIDHKNLFSFLLGISTGRLFRPGLL